MCSFLNEGDLDSASRVFEQMKQANITPEAKALASLTDNQTSLSVSRWASSVAHTVAIKIIAYAKIFPRPRIRQ